MKGKRNPANIILNHPTLGRLVFEHLGGGARQWIATVKVRLDDDREVEGKICFEDDAEPQLDLLDPLARKLGDIAVFDQDARQALRDPRAQRMVQSFKKYLFKKLGPDASLHHFGVTRHEDIDDERFIALVPLAQVFVSHDPEQEQGGVDCLYERLPARLRVGFWWEGGGQRRIRVDGPSGGFSVETAPTKERKTQTLTHPTLGRLEFDEDGVANTALMLGKTSVPLDISFPEGERPTLKALARSGRRASEPTKLDADARNAIAKDLALGEEGEVVHLYKTHHFEELDAATLAERFGLAELALLDDARFIARLQLARIGLYPKEPHATFVCDYTLGADLTDYIIAVTFDNRGRVRSIAMES